ncbi:MAG: Spy/CpxP family protein refolding chaperone [Planctomycetota bacterium]|nr:Spy/CpxP family protein refolding chaperone [Planctomycetota bacterium]
MKRLTWWALPLAAAMVFGLATADAALAAKDEGAKAKRAKGKGARSGLRGEYAIMVSQCNLTAEQETQLKAKVEARKQAMAEWEQAHGDKAGELKKAMKEARDAGKKDEVKRLGQEMKTLSAERRRLHEKTMADIYGILTPDQKITWAGFRLYRRMMRRYKKTGLTEEQQATIRKMSDATAEKLADAKADEKAEDQIVTALRSEIEQNILTAKQREALEKKPTKERPEKRADRGGKGKKDAAEG